MKKAILFLFTIALAVSAAAQVVTYTVQANYDTVRATTIQVPVTTYVSQTTYDTLKYKPPGINSLAIIQQDMSANGEATPWTPIKPGTNPPAVWFPSSWSWYWHNNLAYENNNALSKSKPGGVYPYGSPDVFPWYVIFSYGGNVACTNTRVQVRNIAAYWYSKSQQKWILAVASNTADALNDRYDTDYNYGQANMRNETVVNGGGTSVKPTTSYCIQGWTTGGFGAINPTDVGAFFTYCEARLIVDNPALPDDRYKANLIVCPGMDYKNPAYNSVNGGTVGSVAAGRFKIVTNSWRPFNVYAIAPGVTPPSPPINKFD